jgi:hypothetical protein
MNNSAYERQISLLSLYVYIIKYTIIIFDTIELAAIFILPVKVLSIKLFLAKVSPLIKTLSIALYTIDELSINNADTENNIKNCKKIFPIDLDIE